MPHLGISEIIVRILAAVVIAGIIGYDREQKNHPAGIRTHTLVCVGACIIALIQVRISIESLEIAAALPNFQGVVRADPARLIAQVISGIGFLGAGTIVTTRHNITGLTTAASLWATAGIGLAIGMGYYRIAIVGALTVLLVLVILKKFLRIHTLKKIEIKSTNKQRTILLNDFFKTKGISISNCSYTAEQRAGQYLYTNIYTVTLPKHITYPELVIELSTHSDITTVRLINL